MIDQVLGITHMLMEKQSCNVGIGNNVRRKPEKKRLLCFAVSLRNVLTSVPQNYFFTLLSFSDDLRTSLKKKNPVTLDKHFNWNWNDIRLRMSVCWGVPLQCSFFFLRLRSEKRFKVEEERIEVTEQRAMNHWRFLLLFLEAPFCVCQGLLEEHSSSPCVS